MSNFLNYIENIVRILVARSLHQTLFKVHYALNLIVLLLMSYLYAIVGQTWTLLIFITALTGIQIPLLRCALNKRSFAKSFNSMYFVQSALFYFILATNTIIVNIFYGDTVYGLLKLALFANSPTIYSLLCLLLLDEVVKSGGIEPGLEFDSDSDTDSDDESDDFACEFDTDLDPEIDSMVDNEYMEEYYHNLE